MLELKEKAGARDILASAKQFDANEWLSRGDLESIQLERLKELLVWSKNHNDYYRNLFESVGFNPAAVNCLSDLSEIPLLHKSTLLEPKQSGLFNEDFPTVHTETSGTTGSKLSVYNSINYGRCVVFPLWGRALRAGGLKPQDHFQPITYIGRRFYPTYGRTNELSLFEKVPDLYRQVCESQPNAIRVVPTTLENICLYMLNENKPSIPSLKRIFTFAETLSESTNELFQSTLGVAPVDQYAAVEVASGIAWQCEHRTGYHINSDNVIVELLDDNDQPVGPGESGKVVVTDLSSAPVPIIRYELGDMARWREEPCACGRQTHMLEQVEGRIKDLITLRSGLRVNAHIFNTCLYSVPDAIQYQVFEQADGSLLINLVIKSEADSDQVVNQYQEALAQSIVADERFVVKQVDKIGDSIYQKRRLINPYQVR